MSSPSKLRYLCVSTVIALAGAGAACARADAPAPPLQLAQEPTITPLATFFPRPSRGAEVTPPAGEPPPADSARILTRGSGARRAVALTFDAGTDAGNTADILRTLREHGVRATFALTGVWAERHRDLLFSISAGGHQIINNSYSHKSFTGASTSAPPLTPEERALELSRAEVTVYRYTSRTTKPFFRPPYGDYDAGVLRDVVASGYDEVVLWTVDTFGWNGASTDDIVERTLTIAGPGAIIAMHVDTTSADAAALERVIEALSTDGYAFETIDEIVQ